MHKSYKKTIAILVTCALMSALLCIPVSALTSNGSTLTVTSDTNMYTPGVSNSQVYPQIYNGVDTSSIHFSNTLTDLIRQVDIYFKFDSPNLYGTLKLYIYSNHQDTHSTVVSNPSYQGVYDSNGNRIDFLYTHFRSDSVTTDIVFIEYTGYIPNNFFVRTYYQLNNPTTTYYITDYSFTPIDKGTQDLIDNQNQNAQDIQANQDANTDKIIQSQEQLHENEKNEANNSGNSAADDVAGVMPNESEGFINALRTFTSAMSTTDTECNITFPGIKIPALEGLFPDTTLLEAQEIDFSQALGLIPEDIMKLIRALTTIGLIVFCFKELYATISEALTRRQSNE